MADVPGDKLERSRFDILAQSLWREFRDHRAGLRADEERDLFVELVASLLRSEEAASIVPLNEADLRDARVVLGEMREVADTDGMDGETVIPVWPKDVAHDFAPLKVKHIVAIMRALTAMERGTVQSAAPDMKERVNAGHLADTFNTHGIDGDSLNAIMPAREAVNLICRALWAFSRTAQSHAPETNCRNGIPGCDCGTTSSAREDIKP